MPSMSDETRRLGELVRDRREALDLTQRDAEIAAKVSHQTWWQVENGRGASPRTLRAVDRALRWRTGSAQDVLKGGDPVEDPDLEPATLDQCRERIRELEAAFATMKAQVAELTAHLHGTTNRGTGGDDRPPSSKFEPGPRAEELAQTRPIQPPPELAEAEEPGASPQSA